MATKSTADSTEVTSATEKVEVVMVSDTIGATGGDTVKVAPDVAKELIRNGHAVKAG